MGAGGGGGMSQGLSALSGAAGQVGNATKTQPGGAAPVNFSTPQLSYVAPPSTSAGAPGSLAGGGGGAGLGTDPNDPYGVNGPGHTPPPQQSGFTKGVGVAQKISKALQPFLGSLDTQPGSGAPVNFASTPLNYVPAPSNAFYGG